MKNQTLSIERMKHLKDLGVDVSKASMCWWLPMERLRSEEGYLLDAYEPHVKEQMSDDPIIMTFTLQDMLDRIPVLYQTKDGMSPTRKYAGDTTYYPNIYKDEEGEYSCEYISSESDTWIGFSDFSPIESAYLMLCWLAENGHLKGGKP